MNRFRLPSASALFLALVILNAVAAEEAEYLIVIDDGPFQLRDYAPQVVAEVIVEGGLEDAGSTAFKPLFDYISGANATKRKIPMTAPVAQQAAGEKIAMTAPVSQQRNGSMWAVSFMMPADRTIENLPTPNDAAVSLREVPARRMAAVRYSGVWSQKRYNRHKAELETWLTRQQLTAIGEPVWARYDPPFMPWFMRRNEILLPVASDTQENR